MDSSSNIFTRLFRPRQTTPASDPSPRVPQLNSDSTTAPSPCGLVVSLELKQRGSEASSPAEALRSSPSEEEKAKSDAGGDTKEQESEGGEDGASDKGDQNEIEKEKDHKEDDCATPINIKVKETILEEKEECGEKPRQNERRVAEAEVNGKEISKEKPEQTECKVEEVRVREKDESVEKLQAAKSKAPEKEELNLGKAEYKAVKVNMKENDDSKEEPGQTDIKAANKKVKKKGSFGGAEVERGSTGEVESGEIEVGGKQMERRRRRRRKCRTRTQEEEEKDGRRGGEEEKAEEVQNENAIWNETEKEGNDKKEETCGGLKKGAQYPVRPDAEDCAIYMKMWTCKFGSDCKFNHPARKKVQDAKQKMKEKEESKEKPGQTKSKVKKEEVSKEKSGQTKSKDAQQKMKEKEESKEKPGQTKSKVKKEEVSKEKSGQTKSNDAKQKMKETEESKEKPGQIKSKVKKEEVSKDKSGQTKSKATKEKVKEKTDSTENARQFECKVIFCKLLRQLERALQVQFYSSPEGCKFGKVCKVSHKKTNSVPPPVGLNFMGMPIRLGVKDCPSYMLTGACKADANCKFNHPDPTPVIDEPPVQDGHAECSSSQSAQNFPVWFSQGTPNKTTPFVPIEYSATHPYTEWSPYEVG